MQIIYELYLIPMMSGLCKEVNTPHICCAFLCHTVRMQRHINSRQNTSASLLLFTLFPTHTHTLTHKHTISISI